MNQEAVTLVDDLKTERSDDLARLRTGRATPGTSVQVSVPGSKLTLSERIKARLSSMLKALEGDHDFHNYLGG